MTWHQKKEHDRNSPDSELQNERRIAGKSYEKSYISWRPRRSWPPKHLKEKFYYNGPRENILLKNY